MLKRNYITITLSIIGLILMLKMTLSHGDVPLAQPVSPPAAKPFKDVVSGAGLIEASTRNIAIGSHYQGVVSAIFVKLGDHVETGAPLFKLDDRQALAEVKVREAAVLVARESLNRLQSLPRKEEIPISAARVKEMSEQAREAEDRLRLQDAVHDPRVVSRDDRIKTNSAVKTTKARLEQAQASDELLKAGAWQHDIAIATSQLVQAETNLQAVKTELERLTVRSPIAGEILQLTIKLGEFVSPGTGTPLVIGDTRTLHVRVDIDENDAWRVKSQAKAVGSLRGNSGIKSELNFVRFEPMVIPKKSLTGSTDERVDTRVLQVIYAINAQKLPLYVGQQMDVYLEAGNGPDGRTP
ncbi:MAG TPA: HlyD family efflux transporter periplasmic adaptor subunit [Desulfuromonadales bacterium]|nr:HlyD family efflux transporter periplasmic adaptor subunit [Desulfuromonadales bacterium]HIJ87562.1 HlyD family efflux transporter periplasmic adaptor subunit [Desulfuromonadales bacterium]